jgi:phosphate-selective porin
MIDIHFNTKKMKCLNPYVISFFKNKYNCYKLYRTFFFLLYFFIITTPLRSQQSDTTKATTNNYDPLRPLLHQALTPDGKGNITFTPGARIQTRYDVEKDETGDPNNDFFIRRLRLKGGGRVFDIARYYFEVKIDNTGKFNSTPRAQVENAWLDFRIKDAFIIRAGLYDMVFSRNALTSDSKLLLMDRSLIKNALTVLGVTDNTVGILAHGRPLLGHLSYGIGIFDNLGFETAGVDTTIVARKSSGAMTTARIGYDFFDPASSGGYGDYRSSYIGQGKRLTVSGNAAYLSQAEIGDRKFSLFAYGVDVFFNTGGLVIEAEYDAYRENDNRSGYEDINGDGWYLQAGYLIFPKIELAARYQEMDFDHNSETDKLMWTSIGLNYYLRGHNLKMQAEYIFKREQVEDPDNDLFQVQLQFDF